MHFSTRTRTARAVSRGSTAFSLLEVLLATVLIAMLLTGAFAVVQGSVQLGAEVVEVEDRSLLRVRLVEILRDNLRNLQPEASLLLTVREESGGLSPELAFVGDGAALSLGGSSAGSGGSALVARPIPGGFFALDLLLLDEKAVGLGRRHPDARKGPRLELLPELSAFRLRVYDPISREWLDNWSDYGRRPSHLELHLALPGDVEAQRYVFWLPPVSRLPAERFMNQETPEGVELPRPTGVAPLNLGPPSPNPNANP